MYLPVASSHGKVLLTFSASNVSSCLPLRLELVVW